MTHGQAPLVVTVYDQGGSPLPPDVVGPAWRGYFAQQALPGGVGQCLLPEGKPVAGPILLVSDVDSTVIKEEVIDLLAAHAGTGDRVSRITERAMAGELDFAQSLRARVAELEGLPETAFEAVAQQVTVRPGTRELFAWVHAGGGAVAVVSGGFSPVVESLAAKLGIDHQLAIDLECKSGVLTGRVNGPIVTEKSKRDFVTQLRERYGFTTVVLGDGANDLLMLREADIGIGVHAKPLVRQEIPNYLDTEGLDPVVGLLGHSLTQQ